GLPSYQSFLITHGVTKAANIKTLIETASIFGCQVVFVGAPKIYSKLPEHFLGRIHHNFARLEDAVAYLKEQWQATIYGIEIMDEADNVEHLPFTSHSAFIMGSEGHGMSEKQKSMCDRFIYISQYGGGTASLNVAVASSIIMQRFAVWAQQQKKKEEAA
ncbi:unnamed protein product, partial [Heterosigma akashiwo]